MTTHKLPTIAELHSSDLQQAFKNEQLNQLLNANPNPEWIKQHPYIKNYNYLPIDKVEFLLRKIFKEYRIEVLREGTSFNGVYVVVRVHYLNPVTREWAYHDGIGAHQLQTKQGSSPADLGNINNGALSMAFPIAKTIAIKDACDHFGNLFGANLNRKDAIAHTIDNSVVEAVVPQEDKRWMKLIEDQTTVEDLESLSQDVPLHLIHIYKNKHTYLNGQQ